MEYFIYIFLVILFYILLKRNFEGKINLLSKQIDALKSELDEVKAKLNSSQALPNETISPTVHSDEIHVKNEESIADSEILQQQGVSRSKTSQKQDVKVSKTNSVGKVILDFFQQNALSVLGILTLVLGVGYFVKYAIDKNWIGESMRMFIGLMIGFILVGIGWFLRKNYNVFSAILSGGGVAVLYFSITIGFREYHLFSQNTAFVFLVLITLFSVGLSNFLKSETLSIFSFIGGFLAPAMISTGESNYVFLFSYLLILNLGMLLITYLKSWNYLGWIALIGTQLYLLVWAFDGFNRTAIAFIFTFYLISYAFALKRFFKKEKPANADYLLLVVTNFLSVFFVTIAFQQLRYSALGLPPIIFAMINLGLMIYKIYQKQLDVLFSILLGLLMSLLSFAMIVQFDVKIYTTFFALEAVLMLFLWKKIQTKIFITFFKVLAFLCICGLLFIWLNDRPMHFDLFFNANFFTGILIALMSFLGFKVLENNDSKFGSAAKVNLLHAAFFIVFVTIFREVYKAFENKSVFEMVVVLFLYCIYFLFLQSLIFKKFFNKYAQKGYFNIVILALSFLLVAVSLGFQEQHQGFITKQLYFEYLLYLIPTAFIYLGFRKSLNEGEKRSKIEFGLASLLLVFFITVELCNLYLMRYYGTLSFDGKRAHFSMLFLPIIWTIFGILFLFIGTQKNLLHFRQFGFALIGLTILKLYVFDVWRMDQVSKIIAFILLGLLLLSGSFLFQRLKSLLINTKNTSQKENFENDSAV